MATVDPDSSDVYYVNTLSEDVSWERPSDFAGPLVTQDGKLLSPTFVCQALCDSITAHSAQPAGATYDIKTGKLSIPLNVPAVSLPVTLPAVAPPPKIAVHVDVSQFKCLRNQAQEPAAIANPVPQELQSNEMQKLADASIAAATEARAAATRETVSHPVWCCGMHAEFGSTRGRQ